jgi:phenylacetate-CoA ligase
MNILFEKFYDVAPNFIKDIMTSGYGYILYRDRYRGKFWEYLQEQMNYLSLPFEQLEKLQNDRLKLNIVHAYENVPYYRHIFESKKLKPADIQNVDDLTKLPILEKSTIREQPNSLLARNIKKSQRIIQHTSGTTGTPLDVYNSKDGLRYSHALEFFVRSLYGISLKSKQASFIGRIIVPHHQTKPPFWHYNFIINQYLFSSYHMNDEYLPYYIKKLEAFKPDEIVGYPSSLYTLARFICENNIKSIRPKVVFGNSEPLLDYQREEMSEAFQCPIREWYSSTENAFFAYECGQKNYHIVYPYGVVEILDDKDTPVKQGVVGNLVVTSLTNYAMPFIRYRIGDSASIGYADCPCGNKSAVFKEVIGRTDDILVTPDGRKIGRLDPVFKGLRGIKECQIVQKDIDRISLNVVKDSSYSEKDESMLRRALERRMGNGIVIDVCYLDRIPRGNNGKFRAVISEINPKRSNNPIPEPL